MKNSSQLLRLVPVTTLLALAGCAAMPDSLRVLFGPSVEFVQPPQNTALQNFNALQVSADGKSAILVDPSMKVLGETKLGLNPLFERVSTSAPDKNQLKAAQWASLGYSNLKFAENEKPSVENRTQCRDGKLFCKDKDVVARFQVRCLEREVTASVQLQVSDMASRKDLTRFESTSSKSDKQCSDSSGSLATMDSLKSAAMAELVMKSTGQLLPGKKTRPLELIENDPKATPEVNASLKEAFARSRAGKIEYTEQVYAALESSGVNSFALYFNLGLINQMKGNFKAAQGHYLKAREMVPADKSELLQKYISEVGEFVNAGKNVAWGS